jgi:hypothetical protein
MTNPSRILLTSPVLCSSTAPAFADALFWTTGNALWRADLDGGNARSVTELDPIPLPHLGGFALHGEKIYWRSDVPSRRRRRQHDRRVRHQARPTASISS